MLTPPGRGRSGGLVIGDVETFAAGMACALSVGFVTFNFDDTVLFDFQAAVLCTQDTTGFEDSSHSLSFPTALATGCF